ncbi:MAG: hypothetical protein MR379_07740 [Clostridiales bacterium]|nr:hypothetical protein [Clostridiales bacterium]
MKKIIAFILSCIMIISLNACENPENINKNAENSNKIEKRETLKSFLSMDDFEQYVSAFWVCETTYNDSLMYYKVRFFVDETCFSWDFSYSSNETLSQCFKKVLQNCERKSDKSFHNIVDLLISKMSVEGLESKQYNIKYDVESSKINTVDGQTVGVFLDNGTLKCNDDIYYKDGNINNLHKAFIEAKEGIFTDTYGKLDTYKDVKYDPFSYCGKNFLLTGTAELDDYYNYDYIELEVAYFCICFTPEGGSFSDRWYIYGYRLSDKYKELYEKLKEGPISNITLICYGQFYNSIQHEMAELVDYYY